MKKYIFKSSKTISEEDARKIAERIEKSGVSVISSDVSLYAVLNDDGTVTWNGENGRIVQNANECADILETALLLKGKCKEKHRCQDCKLYSEEDCCCSLLNEVPKNWRI